MSVRDDATPSLRLEGLVPRMEEFHNQAELLKVGTFSMQQSNGEIVNTFLHQSTCLIVPMKIY